MSRSLVKGLRIGCPAGLVEFLENPPLVGDETCEDYAKFFRAIVADLNPVDAQLAVHQGCCRSGLADPPRAGRLSRYY